MNIYVPTRSRGIAHYSAMIKQMCFCTCITSKMKVKMHQSYLWIEIPIHEMSPLDYNSAPKSSFHSVIDRHQSTIPLPHGSISNVHPSQRNSKKNKIDGLNTGRTSCLPFLVMSTIQQKHNWQNTVVFFFDKILMCLQTIVSTVPAGGPSPSGAMASAGALTIKFTSLIYVGQVLERLTSSLRNPSVNMMTMFSYTFKIFKKLV